MGLLKDFQKIKKEFIHLHCHNNNSLLDGFGRVDEHVARAKELGMSALASTNHNHLLDTVEFQKACNKEGIKPIIGCELYWTHDRNMITKSAEERYDIALAAANADGIELPKKITKKAAKELISDYIYDTKGYHIILIAKNQTGWKNLSKIQSEASRTGLFNGRFHCDNELLSKYSEGIIVTTACIGSVVSTNLRNGKVQEAIQVLNDWINIFGKENVFAEIQGLDWDEQYNVNRLLITIAKQLDIKVIATNDVHYPTKEDINDHDTLLCIGTGRSKNDTDRMKYEEEFWIKSYDEMIDSFRRQDNSDEYLNDVINALHNTAHVNSMIEHISLGSDVPLFTETDIPEGYTNERYLSECCWKGLYTYLKNNPQLNRTTYEARLKHELNVINTKGYAPYMLTTDEFVKDANYKLDCMTGPGRGWL